MRLIPVISTIALAVYAVAAGASGFDRMSANVWNLERVVPRPFRAEAYRAAASLAMIREDYPQALQAAGSAVWHDPVNPDSTATLASAQALNGNEEKAYNAFRVAARFGWRNQATQAYWFNAALDSGDYGVAADRADAILRVRPNFQGREDLLELMESTPETRAALIDHLVAKPYWVRNYLEIFNVEDGDLVTRRTTVLKEAAASGKPLGCDTVNRFTRALLLKNRRADAEAVWNGNCPRQKVGSLVADPSFADIGMEKSPFGWATANSGDVSVSEIAGKGISVHNTASTTRRVLVQPVNWPAGSYLIRLKAAQDDANSRNRFAFSLGCAENAGFPARTNGDPTTTGQILQSDDCAKGQLVLWMKPGSSPVELQSVSVDRSN